MSDSLSISAQIRVLSNLTMPDYHDEEQSNAIMDLEFIVDES